MTSVFDLIFDLFQVVIHFLKQIPITQNVSLFDFSVALLIMTLTVVAFVPAIRVGPTNTTFDIIRSDKFRSERDSDKKGS